MLLHIIASSVASNCIKFNLRFSVQDFKLYLQSVTFCAFLFLTKEEEEENIRLQTVHLYMFIFFLLIAILYTVNEYNYDNSSK